MLRPAYPLEPAPKAVWHRRLVGVISGFGCGLLAPLFVATIAAAAPPDRLPGRNTVVFFPTTASHVPGGSWLVDIHGWVFQRDKNDRKLRVLEKLFDLDDHVSNAEQQNCLHERLRPFVVDNESRRRIEIAFGEARFVMPPTAANGHFETRVTLSAERVAAVRVAGSDQIGFRAVLQPDDARVLAGTVHLLDDTGISVISDIDDTIRVTGVGNKKAVLNSTFLEPLQPVPGMAELYAKWAREQHTAFHYVSASPWQLYEMLDRFLADSSFPPATFHLKLVRLKDSSFFNLFDSPADYKPPIIEQILERHPSRTFVLVGDSGEKDPEIYAQLAAAHPAQVKRILIRDVKGEEADGARFSETFRGLPRELWQVFRDPKEIRNALSGLTPTTRPATSPS